LVLFRRGAQGEGGILKRLFTLGYEKRSIDEFVALLITERVDVLIDVRETAWSHKPGFSRTAFERALGDAGIQYVHARFAGNPKRLRSDASTHEECLLRYAQYLDENPTILAEFTAVVERLHKEGKRICITCFERHPDDCHRGILASRWESARKGKVDHLSPDGCRRLVPA